MTRVGSSISRLLVLRASTERKSRQLYGDVAYGHVGTCLSFRSLSRIGVLTAVYDIYVRTKEKECAIPHKGLQASFFPPSFPFSLFQIPLPSSSLPLPFISHFFSLCLSVSPPLPAYLPPSLPPSKIPLSFHLSFFLRARSVAHVPGARSRARTQEISLSLSLSCPPLRECERERLKGGERRSEAGGREMEGSKKNAPVEQLLHDSHECRYVCVYMNVQARRTRSSPPRGE